MRIGNRDFDLNGKTYIMGILNVTPDSFSDGGSYKTMKDVLNRVEVMIDEGADVIDVGGESTRPGYTKLSDEEETKRVVPVIREIKKHFDVPLSVDTYKYAVAKAALDAGADLLNDIWGFKYDPRMATLAGEYGCACCLMHNRDKAEYDSFMEECLDDLKSCVDIAKSAGVRDEQIILDPGIGFGKTLEHNLIALKQLGQFNRLGYPVLLGTSRKSVIGRTLDLPVDERVEGTIATSVLAVMNDMAFIRVHDIKANRRAIDMAMAIKNIEMGV